MYIEGVSPILFRVYAGGLRQPIMKPKLRPPTRAHASVRVCVCVNIYVCLFVCIWVCVYVRGACVLVPCGAVQNGL